MNCRLVIAESLVWRVPVQPQLDGRVGAVWADRDLDRMAACGKLDRMTHIVQAVAGRQGIVLIGLQDIAMNVTLERSGHSDALLIDEQAGVRSQGLQIHPITAGFLDHESTGPCDR